MKLERMHLRNFRCFEELTIEFDPKLTVIVADNGLGKTAILDAIASGFGRYLTKLPGVTGRDSKITDIRIEKQERSAIFLLLVLEALDNKGTPIVWSGVRRRFVTKSINAQIKQEIAEIGASFKPDFISINDLTSKLILAHLDETPYFLPVIAYYGTNRLSQNEVQRRTGFKKRFSRFEALAGALEPNSQFRKAFEWFNAMEDQERREKESRRDFEYRLPELQLVREAIENMLKEGKFSHPRTEIRPLRFVMDREMPDGTVQTLRISQLSDGYKVVLGVVMDLARRMTEANSGEGVDNQEQKKAIDLPAIVLIDEVDLHLHPSWQQRILPDLMRTFPATQFIVTTHSPQVLSTIKRENIRIIAPDTQGKLTAQQPLAMTYGEPSGDVLHSVMMVDPQPPVKEKKDLQRLTDYVDQGKYQTKEAQRLMQSLNAALGEQHPQLQRLRRSIQRQKMLKG